MIKASIIIPTYNRLDVIGDCLHRLEKQKYKNFEVIIVDDGYENRNKLKFILQKLKLNIVYIKQNHAGSARARNLALKVAKGEILIFINDDSLVDTEFVDKHIKFHLKEKSINYALSGPFVVAKELSKTPIMKWLINDSNLHFVYKNTKDNIVPWNYFWTCNLSINKQFFLKNNLKFDETFSVAAWEDVEFGYRANKCGLIIKFDPGLVAYHWHSFNYESLMSRYYSHGRGLYFLSKKLPRKLRPYLARIEYRLVARIILFLTFSNILIKLINKLFDLDKYPSNFLLQYLIVAKKIEGWDFERRRNED